MNKENFFLYKSYFAVFLLIVVVLAIYLGINKSQNKKVKTLQSIKLNLLTSVHENLPWKFSPIEPIIFVKPGDVFTVEYKVENLSEDETTGVATFAYFPSQYGAYINKINCFCYDARTLKPKEKDKYSLVMFVDPEVTKDSKTRNIKEVTIQFIFFDYKEYKKTES